MRSVIVPADTDYIGVYLTNRCFLSCPYCITNHNEAYVNSFNYKELDPSAWIEALNRLVLPEGIPLTLQGGEPFLYKGIGDILEKVHHKIDILTALPPSITVHSFRALKTLDWNQRTSPYPTIRVSFHKGQNDYKELIGRIQELQEVVSIGLYHLEHPDYSQLTEEIRSYAKEKGVEFRTKEFLGKHEGQMYGQYKFPDACVGKPEGKKVKCRNTVFPIDPEGNIYRCHADLYARRKDCRVGNITDPGLALKHEHRDCDQYGACSPCDVKVKTNHLQQFGYTSIDIYSENEEKKSTDN